MVLGPRGQPVLEWLSVGNGWAWNLKEGPRTRRPLGTQGKQDPCDRLQCDEGCAGPELSWATVVLPGRAPGAHRDGGGPQVPVSQWAPLRWVPPCLSQVASSVYQGYPGLSFLICSIYFYGARNNTYLPEAAVRAKGKSLVRGGPVPPSNARLRNGLWVLRTTSRSRETETPGLSEPQNIPGQSTQSAGTRRFHLRGSRLAFL